MGPSTGAGRGHGGVLRGLYYLFGPIMFPSIGWSSRSRTSTKTRISPATGRNARADRRWTESLKPEASRERRAGIARRPGRSSRDQALGSLKEDLDQTRIEWSSRSSSQRERYRIERGPCRPTRSPRVRPSAIWSLPRRSLRVYVDEGVEELRGNITAQTRKPPLCATSSEQTRCQESRSTPAHEPYTRARIRSRGRDNVV